jgi:hypothetical protein
MSEIDSFAAAMPCETAMMQADIRNRRTMRPSRKS